MVMGDGTTGDGTSQTDKTTNKSDTEVEQKQGRPCPLCGASMHHRHCKYVCPEHGIVYDCSDTFY